MKKSDAATQTNPTPTGRVNKDAVNGQEWTLKRVMEYIEAGYNGICQLPKDINDSLAAEREQRKEVQGSLYRLQQAVSHGLRWSTALDDNDKLRTELAAEREKWEHLQTENQLWIKRNKQLRTELAEKQKGIDSFRNMWGIACEQLAAAKAAIADHNRTYSNFGCKRIDYDSTAQAGKGKNDRN